MTDLIQNLTALDWEEAEYYFINNPQAVKFDKYDKAHKLIKDKNNRIKRVNCSFIKVDGTIYAIKNGNCIGEGNFGKVKVLQNREGENFAVKIEGRDKRDNSDPELKIMSLLNKFHGQAERKNYNKVFKNIYAPKKLYTVMDLEEGKELFDAIFLGKSRHSIRKIHNEEKKLIIAIKCCEAIKYLHDRRIIHRDIKSENLMFNVENNAVTITAIDFGLSGILPKGENVIQDNAMGTPGFCAPEILEEREGKLLPKMPALYSFSSDIYALGIMFKRDLQLNMGDLFYKKINHLDPKQRFSMEELLDRLYEKLEMQPNLHEISKKMIEDYKKNNLNVRIKFKDDIQSAKTIGELAKIISSYSGDLLDNDGRKLNKKIVAQNIQSIMNNKKMIRKIIKNSGFSREETSKLGVIKNHGIEKKLIALIFSYNNEMIFREKIRKSSSMQKLIEVINQYPGDMYSRDNKYLIDRDALVFFLKKHINESNFENLDEITRNYGIREKVIALSGKKLMKKDVLNSTMQWYRNVTSLNRAHLSQNFVNEISDFKKTMKNITSMEDLILTIENCSDSIYDPQEKNILLEQLKQIVESPFLRKEINDNHSDAFNNFSKKDHDYGIVEAITKIINQSYKKNLNEIQCLTIDILNQNVHSANNKNTYIHKGVNWMLDKHRDLAQPIYRENNEISSHIMKELFEVIKENQRMDEACAMAIYEKLQEIDLLMPNQNKSDIKEFVIELKHRIENDFNGIQNHVKVQNSGNKVNPF